MPERCARRAGRLPVAGMAPRPSTCADNCMLTELTDQTVLRNVEQRYMQSAIYTFTGSILLAVNPYERLPIYDEGEMGRRLASHDLDGRGPPPAPATLGT